MDSLVTRLKELMREHGDDQSSLARKIGCTPGAINQILTGRTQKSRLLPEIADYYDVALPYLLGRWEMRGRGSQSADTLTTDERRFVNLMQRLEVQDRSLVMALVERLVGVKVGDSQKQSGVVGPETLHDQHLGYNSG